MGNAGSRECARDGVRGDAMSHNQDQSHQIAMIPLGLIAADESFNARQVYEPQRITALAHSIDAIGLETPLEVSRREDGGYDLIAGFRRRRALYQLLGSEADHKQIPCRVVPPATVEERMLKNLVSDEGHEPVRRSDQARRFHYLVVTRAVPVAMISRVVTMSPKFVQDLVTCWQNLTPQIRDSWEKSQSRERELPMSMLIDWAKLAPEDQRAAFEHYLDPDAAYRESSGEEIDDEDYFAESKKPNKPKKPSPASEKGVIRTKGNIVRAVEMISKGPMTPERRGALKALAWVLGEKEGLTFERSGETEKGKKWVGKLKQ